MTTTNPLIDPNVRTQLTPDSYSYGGNTYKKETRIDGHGNSYTVDVAQPQAAATPAASTPAPAAGPIENPTIGAVYGDSLGNESNLIEGELDSFYKDPSGFLANKGLSETDVRNKSLAAMQAQIDATNSYYASKLNESRRQGQGRLGSSTAIQARRGLIGSDFGAALTDETNNANTQIYNSIEEERNAKVQALLSEAKTAGEERYQKERDAIEGGLKSRLELAKGRSEYNRTQAERAVKSLIAQGIDPTTLNEAELAKLTDSKTGFGVKSDAIISAYKTAKYTSDKTAAEEKKKRDELLADKALDQKYKMEFEQSKPVSLSEGGRLYDPKTGKQIAYNPKTYAPKDGDGTGSALSPASSSKNLKNVLGTINEAIGISPAAGRSGARQAVENMFVGATDFTKLQALTDTVRSNLLTLNTDPAVKKFFGPQMSNYDTAFMMSAGTPLNVEKMDPEGTKKYLLQAYDIVERAKKAVDDANGIVDTEVRKVRVQLPDGRVGTILESELEGAKAKGAKVIQ